MTTESRAAFQQPPLTECFNEMTPTVNLTLEEFRVLSFSFCDVLFRNSKPDRLDRARHRLYSGTIPQAVFSPPDFEQTEKSLKCHTIVSRVTSVSSRSKSVSLRDEYIRAL